MGSEDRFLFVRDRSLRNTLASRYNELKSLPPGEANPFSVIFLSMSIVEGIFNYLKQIHEKRIKQTDAFKEEVSRHKKSARAGVFKRMTIPSVYKCLHQSGVLKVGEGFEHVCDAARVYRNCIHPDRQLREGLTIRAANARIASGVLDATLNELESLRFVNETLTLRQVCGLASSDEESQLRLVARKRSRMSTIAVSEDPVRSSWSMQCDIEVAAGLILDVLFGYDSRDNFNCLRLDWRANKPCGIYRCLDQGQLQNIFAVSSDVPKCHGGRVSLKVDLNIGAGRLTVSAGGSRVILDASATSLSDFVRKVGNAGKCGFQAHMCPTKMIFTKFDIDGQDVSR